MGLHLSGSTREALMMYSLSFSVFLLPLVEEALGRGSPAASLVMICMAARSVKEDTLIIITVQLGKWLQ
uniref:Uncharacterized protein n=1 Tax=Brassica campestris TaxID=3711 RepID=A0A3P5Z2Y0_BRACM|nr:unnamed protein product [Brassica rapa]